MSSFLSLVHGEVNVVPATYHDGSLAVQLYAVSDGELVTTLSVYLRGYMHHLRPGEFFAKTWTENSDIADEALLSGLIIDTWKRIATPLGQVPVWRYR